VEVFGTHGFVLDGPQTRKDYEDDLPPIVVETPYEGQEVSGPIELTGTANVFEATVSYRLVIEDGHRGPPAAEGFTTATCGTGCRGTFKKKIRVMVTHGPVDATLEVFESSAENGEPLHMVKVPITLVP
ncbi:MAG TPA: Gmad2 immunoglobulin-like domain-containing protein, partial [Actinomycetota bacterium]|nr:Gmad2 immunoglobulin-like domain-containing protein [Actinomycetota bacterium]